MYNKFFIWGFSAWILGYWLVFDGVGLWCILELLGIHWGPGNHGFLKISMKFREKSLSGWILVIFAGFLMNCGLHNCWVNIKFSPRHYAIRNSSENQQKSLKSTHLVTFPWISWKSWDRVEVNLPKNMT
jgi:hypothetical protein